VSHEPSPTPAANVCVPREAVLAYGQEFSPRPKGGPPGEFRVASPARIRCPMSAPNSVEELVQLIRRSGMVDEQKLTAYLQRRELTRGLPADSRECIDELVRDGVLTNFQAEQFLLGKWRGLTIGKYKLLERIGVGGMGQVFLCEHMFMRRRVAVKVLPPAKADQPAALGRFYREARAAGSLEHPNIVRTHDIDQDGNLHFIVMEFVDGVNLLDLVKRFGPLDVGRAVHYARQVALALEYAFRKDIIHRDVKPGNILVDRRGTAKLLDLGLARFYKDHGDLLTLKYDDKIVLGTADYVAPEQVANSHAVDIRADIYALGATLYFLLAGHPAFPTGTVSQKLLWHRTKEPTPIRQVRPEVPEGLAEVLVRMMAKDPTARFQTPAQVAAALEPFAPAEVPPPAPEEIPQLSPAARDGMDDPAADPEPPPEPVTAASAAVVTARRSGPVAAAGPRPVSPFAAPAAWANSEPAAGLQPPFPNQFANGSGQRPGLALPARQDVTETATDQADPTALPSPAADSNPFPADDADPDQRPTPWLALVVVALLILAGLGFAAVAFGSPPADPPPTATGK
jgi:serine/threonine protein kinase